MDLSWASKQVVASLGLRAAGERRLELVSPRVITPPEAAQTLHSCSPETWFPRARSPQAALAGLWLYFGAFDEAHALAQELESAEGSYWHALVHRLEPDAGNSGYWFRRVGRHPIFPALLHEAARLAAGSAECGFVPGDKWNPEHFTAFCESARSRPGSSDERLACDILSAEWRLLFSWCGMRP